MGVSIKLTNPRDVIRVTEKQWQATVVEQCELSGWLWYHTYDSRRSPPGFPDLVMVKKGRIIFAELKVGKNKVGKAQQEWVDLLKVNKGVEVYVWRPEDLQEVINILFKRRKRAPRS